MRKGSYYCVSPNNQAHSSLTHTHIRICQYGQPNIVSRSIYSGAPLSISEASKSTRNKRMILKIKALPWVSKLPSKWQSCITSHNPSPVLHSTLAGLSSARSKPRWKCNRVKKSQLDAQLILSIFRQPLRVSGVSRPIIRRHNRMYTTIGTYYSFWMTDDCLFSHLIMSVQSSNYVCSVI